MDIDRADSLSPTNEASLPFVHDVIIVGAGPCGLAVAARLREQTPSALFTDEEHQRYHWINRHASKAAIKNSKTGNIQAKPNKKPQVSMLVLDSSGTSWMAKWNRLFSALEISHLRSPLFFHPDPHDRDGLLAYVQSKGRENECIEIAGCVGKELSKHQMKKRRNSRKAGEQLRPTITIDERDRKDYFAPPSDVFKDYCNFIAKRYSLLDKDLIQQASMSDIEYDYIPQLSADEKLFTVRTEDSTFYARSVVLSVGAGNAPCIPKPFPQNGCPAACHAFQPLDAPLRERLRKRMPTNVLIIGGGLTSAQIADRSIRQGATKVFHIMRGPMKVKPFDVDLSWMGKFRNHEKASFWSADTDEERAELVKSARGGGSITPRYAKILHQHVASGRLTLHTHTTVASHSYSPLTGTHTLITEPPISSLPEFHFIYFATGVQSDYQTLPYLQTMLAKYPMESIDGLPALTEDLMWDEDVPLFMTGKFAALRLGPGAGNLEGARIGAERIAWAMPDVLRKGSGGVYHSEAGEEEKEGVQSGGYRYAAGIGSRYESLAVEG
ncbi:uncharacterized protein MYCGRDRAFT_97150 [Zymoseptoria tritici IPO323]|uniref:L-ornithine N(5)-monooxygenase [NAD(P)H] n=1 Tax=Zymoseptoria tritici (strain CBS 115943 / IPO323) TaxID=336722 RepID=F9XP19_ZYMTI|nr:uncharacterized protein MYCGRDRAFT_97150 [Zymoseptoria tritici IPO323]EGP82971.1 hypothetical protein MYCGRDRAFT_97150 [Zymoseptoria tritici IPO323]